MLTKDQEIAQETPPRASAAEAEEEVAAPMTTDQVLEFVLWQSSHASEATADRSRQPVLEVTQVFGDSVLQVRHFPKERTVVVGGAATDFAVAVDELSQPAHPLFAHDGEGWVCTVEAAWPAFLESAAGRVSFADLLACGRAHRDAEGRLHVAFGEAERVVVHVGAVAFCAQRVYPSKRVVPAKRQADHAIVGVVGFMSFCAAMLGLALSFVPAPPKATKMEAISRLVELYRKPEEKPEPPKPVAAAAPKETVKAPGPEGVARHSDEPSKAIHKQASDQEAARAAGVIGAIANDKELERMLGETGLNGDIESGIAGMIGVRATTNGPGLGERGLDFGGGNKTASLGDIGPHARRGNEWGCDAANCKGTMDGHQPGEISNVGEGGIVLGSLEKSIIDAVIKRNLAQIRYCYQRELTKNPALGGKITEKFVIAGDGSVSSATTKTSTMSSPAVESCINGRFMRFAFPQPKGGGIVVVTYPFVFAPG